MGVCPSFSCPRKGCGLHLLELSDQRILQVAVPVRGKAAKRRQWRKKRAGFEEAPWFADAKRLETGNGATVERVASAPCF